MQSPISGCGCSWLACSARERPPSRARSAMQPGLELGEDRQNPEQQPLGAAGGVHRLLQGDQADSVLLQLLGRDSRCGPRPIRSTRVNQLVSLNRRTLRGTEPALYRPSAGLLRRPRQRWCRAPRHWPPGDEGDQLRYLGTREGTSGRARRLGLGQGASAPLCGSKRPPRAPVRLVGPQNVPFCNAAARPQSAISRALGV
jgi:hypothetical protein